MNELFEEIQPGQLVLATSAFKLKGKAKPVFDMLHILAETRLIEADKDWWAVKAWIMAQDGGKAHKYRWNNEKTKESTTH